MSDLSPPPKPDMPEAFESLFGAICQYITEYACPTQAGLPRSPLKHPYGSAYEVFGILQKRKFMPDESQALREKRHKIRARFEQGLRDTYLNEDDALSEEELIEIRDMAINWFPCDKHKPVIYDPSVPRHERTRRFTVIPGYYDPANIRDLAMEAAEIAAGRLSKLPADL